MATTAASPWHLAAAEAKFPTTWSQCNVGESPCCQISHHQMLLKPLAPCARSNGSMAQIWFAGCRSLSPDLVQLLAQLWKLLFLNQIICNMMVFLDRCLPSLFSNDKRFPQLPWAACATVLLFLGTGGIFNLRSYLIFTYFGAIKADFLSPRADYTISGWSLRPSVALFQIS